MIRKLILTTVCGLLACAPQGSSAYIAREYTQAEKDFVAPVDEARAVLSTILAEANRLVVEVPSDPSRVDQSQAANQAQAGGEQARKRRSAPSPVEESATAPRNAVNLKPVIEQLSEVISLCDQKIAENKKMAGSCGIPQKQGQAVFYKEFLTITQKLLTGERLTPDEGKKVDGTLRKADRLYRGTLGPLVIAAQQTLAQKSQATHDKIKPVTTAPQRPAPKPAQADQDKAKASVTTAQQRSARTRSFASHRQDVRSSGVKKKNTPDIISRTAKRSRVRV